MSEPRISFAIPYYANREYLREAIDSVRSQTVPDWELVIVDDRGPEPADDLVAAYDDSRITYLRNEVNLGLSGNWNECIRRVGSDLVTLLHADDRLLPQYAERVLAAADANPDANALFTDAAIIGSDGSPTTTPADLAKRLSRRDRRDHALRGDAGLAPLAAGNYILCPTLCLRRSALPADPFDGRWRFVPDWDLTCRILLNDGVLFSVREPLLEYRRHGGSQTALLTADSSRFVEEIQFMKEIQAAAEAKGWRRTARTARRRITVRGHLAFCVVLDLLGRRRKAAAEKWRLLLADLRG